MEAADAQEPTGDDVHDVGEVAGSLDAAGVGFHVGDEGVRDAEALEAAVALFVCALVVARCEMGFQVVDFEVAGSEEGEVSASFVWGVGVEGGFTGIFQMGSDNDYRTNWARRPSSPSLYEGRGFSRPLMGKC